MIAAEQVAPGVLRVATRTPTLPPATHTNSYLLAGSEGSVLVEPASPYEDEQRSFLAWARALPLRPQALLLTHHHPDHVGGAALYARELGLPLWAHPRSAELLPELPIARHLHDAETIALGDHAWRVLHTPGHASGHVCLHDEAHGTLLVGDMVASVGTILIPPDDGDMGEYLRQLERLAQLDAARALPAHGDPIDQPSLWFRGYIAHRLARESKILQALSRAPIAFEALLQRVYDDVDAAALPFARLSLRAHLDKLLEESRVRESDAGIERAA